MGKVKKPTPDTNPVDGDKLIKATKPKKVKKTEEKPKNLNIDELKNLEKDIDQIGNWVADLQQDYERINELLTRLAKRMGLE